MEIVIIVWLLCGVASGIIASSKGRSGFGWFCLGCLIGIFGVIIIIALPSQKGQLTAIQQQNLNEYKSIYGTFIMRKCPMCQELIQRAAVKCKHCGAEVSPLPEPTGDIIFSSKDQWFCKNCSTEDIGIPIHKTVSNCYKCKGDRDIVGIRGDYATPAAESYITRNCPTCQKPIHRTATKCIHCESDVTPLPEPTGDIIYNSKEQWFCKNCSTADKMIPTHRRFNNCYKCKGDREIVGIRGDAAPAQTAT